MRQRWAGVAKEVLIAEFVVIVCLASWISSEQYFAALFLGILGGGLTVFIQNFGVKRKGK